MTTHRNSDGTSFRDDASPGKNGRQTGAEAPGLPAADGTDCRHTTVSSSAICILLFVLAACAYLPAVGNGFVNFDDNLFVYANDHVKRGLCGESVGWAFSNLDGGFWHPLTWLSLLLDSQLFGLHAGGYHLTSVFLHAANTVLLFVLFRRMTGAIRRSAFVALLFALHPLHVESVAWVSERKDVLSMLFWLLAMLTYVHYVEQSKTRSPGSKAAYGLTLLVFVCGLMSKAMVVTLPVVLLLLDWWPLRRLQFSNPVSRLSAIRRLILEKLPFLAIALAGGVLTLFAQRAAGALRTTAHFPIQDRLANALLSYAGYLGQTLWPVHLAAYYPYPQNFPVWPDVAAALLLLLISIFVLRSSRNKPYLAFGWLWYVVTLLPVAGLIQVGGQSHADRYTYMPLIGVFTLLVWGAAEWTMRWRQRTILLRAAAAATALICLALTELQIGYWKDGEALFRHSLAVTGSNAVAQNNLGAALLDKGRPAEALPRFEEAVRLSPDLAIAHYGLADALAGTRRFDEAISQYRESLRFNPGFADAHGHLARALNLTGLLDEAIGQFREVVRLQPASAQAHSSLGTALLRAQRLDEAISQFREAIRLAPGYVPARANLGAALGRKGQFDEAIGQFQEVLRLTPDDPGARCNLADTLATKGLLDEAIAQYRGALYLAPGDPGAHGHLADALVRRDRIDEAIAEYQEAIRLKPDYAEALKGLGAAQTAKAAKAASLPQSAVP